jgi:dihydroorotase
MHLLLKKVTVLDSSGKYHLKTKDILIEDGVIVKIGDRITSANATVIDRKNCFVSIGWMDIFSDFCDPGFEYKETLVSGSAAALAGGYTDVALLPNTKPLTTGKAGVDYLKQKSDVVNLHPIGVVSQEAQGVHLADMYDMKLAGAVAFSDGIKPIQQSGLMLKALQYVKAFNGVIIQVPDDTSIGKHGLMHEGIMSTSLGMPGKPAIAEHVLIQRDIDLLRYTQSALHITGISTKKSVDLIRKAKKEGLQITCSVTPYHLTFTDAQLATYDAVYKVNPPLRTQEDILALRKGIVDGTIDCIASHHFPQDWDAKQLEFEYAQAGMIGLQTTLPMLLNPKLDIPVDRWVEMLTLAPRRILGLPVPTIAEKEVACITVFCTTASWMFTNETNKSRSDNSPLFGSRLEGKVLAVINNRHTIIHE